MVRAPPRRVCAFQSFRDQNKEHKNVKTFKGFPAIIYYAYGPKAEETGGIHNDAEACGHIVDDANDRNSICTEQSLSTQLLRAKEIIVAKSSLFLVVVVVVRIWFVVRSFWRR